MKKDYEKSCIDCSIGSCNGKNGFFPEFCLSKRINESYAFEKAMDEYKDEENNVIMKNAADIENDFYCQMTRIEETVEFARRMGYRRIGIATCVGLLRESAVVAEIFRKHGFEVFGISCKAGEVPKTDVGIREECMKVGANMCNPIHQALKLKEEQTELNIVMGLCVGHDILFNKYSEAPTTTLVVKDRVLGHNPVAAIYTANTYYKKLK